MLWNTYLIYLDECLMQFLGSSVWLRKACRSTFTAAKPRLKLFNLLMTTDCSKIAVTESAETTVHHYLSIVNPGMGRQQTSLWSSARRWQFVHRLFRSSVYGASSKSLDLSHCPLADQLCRNAGGVGSRRCWRRAPPRKAATYQLMAPSQSAVSFPHR